MDPGLLGAHGQFAMRSADGDINLGTNFVQIQCQLLMEKCAKEVIFTTTNSSGDNIRGARLKSAQVFHGEV